MMLTTWAVSLLYPWHPSWPKAKWLVHLPWALIPMWAWYESLMASELKKEVGPLIRIDLILIIPAVGLLFVVYIVRLIKFQRIFQIGRAHV